VSRGIFISLLLLISYNLTLLFIFKAKKLQKYVTSQGLLLGCNMVGLRRKLIFLNNQRQFEQREQLDQL